MARRVFEIPNPIVYRHMPGLWGLWRVSFEQRVVLINFLLANKNHSYLEWTPPSAVFLLLLKVLLCRITTTQSTNKTLPPTTPAITTVSTSAPRATSWAM